MSRSQAHRPDLSTACWRKSTHSGGESNSECIEVADGYPALVPVRDSKDPHGAPLVFTANAWSAFVDAVKAGELPAA
ncbi:DUF397 domain-containing protein [Kitasatospora sp. NBC_00240]|uniref:DUF397 domain-containing protein n=1 Tax=Kitasatospora sp. NBC_00240 TaxID=2903567 RepID=UPI00224EB65E|nr:DUF397 domain-containing protein [Kitasatospora sp. NBC_00240]MCX5211368.1 DUF397 domain-containing protein [Kitasatospora sp. NBC_00240]